MKIIRVILILCFGFLFQEYSAGSDTTETAVAIPFETRFVDPVKIDSAFFKSFKESEQYNYYSFRPKGESLWDKIRIAIWRWLIENIDPNITTGDANVVLWVITGIVIIVLLILLFIYRPSMFYISRKKKLDYNVEEEDIKDTGFEKLIKDALAAGEYNEAIRWRYLSVLKAMQEKELISWNVNKTVNEYARELKSPDLQSNFRSLSKLFLYVRYGNFEADELHYNEANLLSDNLIKRI